MKTTLLLFMLSLISCGMYAQNGNIGIGTISPKASALVDLTSTDKGVLLPRVQLVAVDNGETPVYHPETGLLVYNDGSDGLEAGFYYWNGSRWTRLCSDCQTDPLHVTLTATVDRMCHDQSSTLRATASGGTAPYQFSWNSMPESQTSSSESEMSVTPSESTTYTVIVTDANGRTVSKSVDLTVINPTVTPTEFTVGGVTFTMKPVAGGSFLMGAQKTDQNGANYDPDASNEEGPVERVTLDSYAIGETEVTQALWQAVMGNNPSSYRRDDRANHPVEQVSWEDICSNESFLKKLNTALYSQLCGMHFALPSEKQWEYAAAGGQEGYNANGSRKHRYSGSNTINDVAWFGMEGGNSGDITHPVAAKLPNELGLYDMSGNVAEWCSDCCSMCSLRGGSWGDSYFNCRVSGNSTNYSNTRSDYVGFRLVLVMGDPSL